MSSAPSPKKLHQILISNRGIIAQRIHRTCHRLGLSTYTIYAPKDPSYPIGPGHLLLADDSTPNMSPYLDMHQIVDAAVALQCDAVHPGYGYLSEPSDFAQLVLDRGLVWVGPSPEHIRAFGMKHEARKIAKECGIPILQGSEGLINTSEEAIRESRHVGYPILLKSTAGGGGIGMLVCMGDEDVMKNFDVVKRMAGMAFGLDGVFIEKFIGGARHVEVQIFGDGLGTVVALGERDCSAQRRNQKIMEETPAPNLPEGIRRALHQAAIKLGERVKYASAGTVEFLVNASTNEFYFLEVNTRLQVEHGVTEEAFGVDLVEWMILLASGELGDLRAKREALGQDPHAFSMQVRICAEDPFKNFSPGAGLLSHVLFPSQSRNDHEVIRIDTWIKSGIKISPEYDGLLAKVIVSSKVDRESARSLLEKVLSQIQLFGTETNHEFLKHFVASSFVKEGRVTTRLLGDFQYESLAVDVMEPGTFTTVQDYPGRVGFWAMGVPPSGPMDNLAFRIANRLVGNDQDAAALEITLVGPVLKFRTSRYVAITGANVYPEIDGIPVEMWTRVLVPRNSVLRTNTKAATKGCRSYIAVSNGGFDVPKYMGSKSTFVLGGFGGHAGRALRHGDVLHLSSSVGTPIDSFKVPLPPIYSNEWLVHVMEGPHAAPDFFLNLDFLYESGAWRVHYNSNRLGIRLVGPKPGWARQDGGDAGLHPSNILDTVYAIGSVNFTGDTAVFLTQDGPSLGGFVCPITVIAADLWKLGQMCPGDVVTFKRVTLDVAIEANKTLEREIESSSSSPSPGWLNNVDDHRSLGFDANKGDCAIVAFSGQKKQDNPEKKKKGGVVYRVAGDKHLLIEYGPPMELDLTQRFRVRALMQWLNSNPIKSEIKEIAPGVRSLQIRFDPSCISHFKLLDQLMLAETQLLLETRVPSRMVRLPIAFDCSTTKAALAKYSQSIRNEAPWLPSNIEFIRRINGLDSVQQVEDTILSARYLVLGLGDVYLGAPCAVPWDPRHRLVTTKYNPARTWTAEGEVGIGGVFMCVYGMESPGGYQLVGRTCPIWKNWQSDETPWLLCEFDQVCFYRVSESELNDFRTKFARGEIKLEFETTHVSVVEYTKFLETNAEAIQAFELKKSKAFQEERERWTLLKTTAVTTTTRTTKDEEDEIQEEQQSDDVIVLRAPVTGSVWAIHATLGDVVTDPHMRLVVLEAMKMEIPVEAGQDLVGGHIIEICHSKGSTVSAGDALIKIKTLRYLQLTVANLLQGYISKEFTPVNIIKEIYRRLNVDPNTGEPKFPLVRNAFIHLIPERLVLEEAERLIKGVSFMEELPPLFGIPFVVKDNIDVEGLPTTAACPAFSKRAQKDAHCVARLRKAGALVLGKTNMDQFAAGLVGVRSPYGACSSVFDERFISGGSSSGSAVCVAADVCAFALGTDTAGSGRVPAAFNNIVGLKPTRGRISTRGVVPACASLDCIAIFARTCQDALKVLGVAEGHDPLDPYSRRKLSSSSSVINNELFNENEFTFGCPSDDSLEFFGDVASRGAFRAAFDRLMALGGVPELIDFKPFAQVARLLYGGPWVAERLEAIREFYEAHTSDVLETTRLILGPASQAKTVDAFRAFHKLEQLKSIALRVFDVVDVLLLPTTGTIYTIEQVQGDPIQLNTNLGTYTNFVNLLDLCAVAVPSGFRRGLDSPLPFGVTLISKPFCDEAVLDLANRFHRSTGCFFGALNPKMSGRMIASNLEDLFPKNPLPRVFPFTNEENVLIAVVGAHLRGMPLNHQLTSLHAEFVVETTTFPYYKLYCLTGFNPPRPGLIRMNKRENIGILVEVWRMSFTDFGAFVAQFVPPPLTMGNIQLEDETWVKGFVCEGCAVSSNDDAKDVTLFGGWRTFLESFNKV